MLLVACSFPKLIFVARLETAVKFASYKFQSFGPCSFASTPGNVVDSVSDVYVDGGAFEANGTSYVYVARYRYIPFHNCWHVVNIPEPDLNSTITLRWCDA